MEPVQPEGNPKKKRKNPQTGIQLNDAWRARIKAAFLAGDNFTTEAGMVTALLKDAVRHYEAQGFRIVNYGELHLYERDELPASQAGSSPQQ